MPTEGKEIRFMLRRSAVLLAVVGCFAVLVAAGCGSKSSTSSTAANTQATTSTTHFAKTKFVFHAGLAFGAFHHFIYNPYKAGNFKHPLSHKAAVAKAALAAAFTYHELKLAANDVKSSKVLSTLFAPITLAASKINGLVNPIKAGQDPASQITSANSSLASIKSTAASNGQNITDQVPSASQLAAGVAQ
jgi:hypothetical protein